jgi:hypothetical protein
MKDGNMAEVKDVILQINPGPTPDKRKVTVEFKLSFLPEEVGKKFSYGVSLHGSDPPGDDEASFITHGALVQTFLFGNGLFKPQKTKSITAQVGDMPVTEARDIPLATLDEDPKFKIKDLGLGAKVQVPNGDEIFASVQLLADTAISAPFIVPL